MLAKENMDVVGIMGLNPLALEVVGMTSTVQGKGRKTKSGGEPAPVRNRYYCHCIMEDGSESYLMAKAGTASEASEKIHEGYRKVEYVLDILTPHEMERRKRALRPSMLASKSLR